MKPEWTIHHLAAIRRAILSVIDDGDPKFRPAKEPVWTLYHENEDFANRQRLDFCDAVQVYLMNEGTNETPTPRRD